MPNEIHLRPPLPADYLEIAALIETLIPRYLARGDTAEGAAILREDAKEGTVAAKLGGLLWPGWAPAFVAISAPRLVGFGAASNAAHIDQLHIAEGWHGRGIGHRLANALIAEIVRHRPRTHEVTLDAAVGALESYMRMGFVPVGPRFTWRGISAQPMALRLR